MGIPSLRPRRALTGATIYEVPGEQSNEKTDTLAAKLRSELNNEEVKVARPVKTAELRLSGLDDLTDSQAVADAMARVGGCVTWEVQVGAIRRPRGGLGSVWVRCPAAAARKLTEATRVQVGWVMARVEALRAKPAQCYKCLRTGHTIGGCTSPIDSSSRCYRCGGEGHIASRCDEEVQCPLCADLGRPAGHRLGGPACSPPPKKKGEDKRRRAGSTGACGPNAKQTGNNKKGVPSIRETHNMEAVEGPGPSQQQEGSSQEEAMDTTVGCRVRPVNGSLSPPPN